MISTEVAENQQLKLVDFFCGAGGMSCGFADAGVKVLAGIDIESQFKETYLANHEGSKFINRDIIKYQPQELQNDIGIRKYEDDLVFVGCSPCQYWSKVNTHRHAGSYTSNLISDFQRFVKYFMPGYVVVENVPGILNQSNNHVLLDFLDFLVFHGYHYEYKIVRTDQYGVPQRRKRFVLIATRNEVDLKFPEPKEEKERLTVRNFIGEKNGFPRISDGYIDEDSKYKHWCSALSDLNKRRLAITPHNGGTRLAWSNDPDLQIPAYKGKDKIFRSIYGRMFWDAPAPTITTRFIAISCGRFAHPEEDRGISLREGATLQTFPKNYQFLGGLISVAKQIGNAVPPAMAERLALSIINAHNSN